MLYAHRKSIRMKLVKIAELVYFNIMGKSVRWQMGQEVKWYYSELESWKSIEEFLAFRISNNPVLYQVAFKWETFWNTQLAQIKKNIGKSAH